MPIGRLLEHVGRLQQPLLGKWRALQLQADGQRRGTKPARECDSANAGQVLELLQKIASQRRTTLLVVTHSDEVARLAARRIALRDGRITEP